MFPLPVSSRLALRGLPLCVRLLNTSTAPRADVLEEWRKKIATQKVVETDRISASQFNLLGNTLNDPVYHHNHIPSKGTELPPAWHLAYFPPRVPENELSPDGYEQEWKPPAPYVHRMWAGGELRWSPDNPLRVGDNVSMESSIRDVQFRPAGRRGDSVFIWVDKHIQNEHGWALTESRCWVYVKDTPSKGLSNTTAPSKQALDPEIKDHPDFSVEFTPSSATLFRFSALTFNSHLIHYDHNYATQVEQQKECLVHGPLSFTLMVNSLNRHIQKLDTNRHVESFSYRCLSPLLANRPMTVAGKQSSSNGGLYDLWVSDHLGNVAVKGTAALGFWK